MAKKNRHDEAATPLPTGEAELEPAAPPELDELPTDDEIVAAMVKSVCGGDASSIRQAGTEARARELLAMLRAYFALHS